MQNLDMLSSLFLIKILDIKINHMKCIQELKNSLVKKFQNEILIHLA